MAKSKHDHVIRCEGGSPVVAAATLPEGKFIDWYAQPEPSDRFPGLDAVEYVIDGRVVATGLWPDVLNAVR